MADKNYTPRTDAKLVDLLNSNIGPGIYNKNEWGHTEQMANFARQLERDLITACEERDRYKADSKLQEELKSSVDIIKELRRKLAEAGVEGSPPPGGTGTIQLLTERAQKAEAQLVEMVEALKEIVKGRGEFSTDPFEHASNCIEAMREIAIQALANLPKALKEQSP